MVASGKSGGAPLLARWTTEFDCGYETSWWYVIKDTPFELSTLKAKKRYEINKGIKYFDVKLIDPREYREDLYQVQVAAFSAYPAKYRPTVNRETFMTGIDNWTEFVVFGAFDRDTDQLVGYALCSERNLQFVDFAVLKTMPDFEKNGLNAALVEKILSYYSAFLSNGGFLCDGSRSINHETNFQDYLEKYFGFRKAYCKLSITYNPRIKWLIKPLFLLRKLLAKLDGIGIVHQINAVLKMEEILRSQN